MDYEKAYKEALERAKNLYSGVHKGCKEVIENVFPELAESEDERIREEIISALRFANYDGVYDKHIAYLEKQKEQKVDIDKLRRDLYQSGYNDGYQHGKEDAQKEQEDDEDEDFTIYHPLKNGKGEYECIPYSFYGSLTSFSEDKDLIDFLRTCFYTEEECNEWIEQQKEQKPAEKPSMLEQLREHLTNTPKEQLDAEFEALLEFTIPKSAEWDEKPIAHENDFVSKPKTSCEILKHYLVWAENSEEDCPYTWKELAAAIKDGITALEQKPNQEWSEEDEKMLDECIVALSNWRDAVSNYGHEVAPCQRLIDWLKSLRPSWKPSEEQMEALKAINLDGAISYVGQQNDLISLYNDLKKLM